MRNTCNLCSSLSRSGSEPSLGSRNENQVVGSDSASKRTLVSQENMSPSNRPDTATATPTATHNVSDITHNATETTSILPTMSDLDPQRSPEVTTLNFDNSPPKLRRIWTPVDWPAGTRRTVVTPRSCRRGISKCCGSRRASRTRVWAVRPERTNHAWPCRVKVTVKVKVTISISQSQTGM